MPSVTVHGDAADGALAQFLRHFQHQRAVFDLAGERVQDERQFAVELHVHDRPEDLGHATDDVTCHVYDSFVSGIRRLANARSNGFGAGDDLDQFLGDVRLAGAVVVLAAAA